MVLAALPRKSCKQSRPNKRAWFMGVSLMSLAVLPRHKLQAEAAEAGRTKKTKGRPKRGMKEPSKQQL
eukprot:scaffold24315_cov21-Tisochrysis_lutea.AAC.1